jgi:hypothetical protein
MSNYLDDDVFTALFDDVGGNWERICLTLALLSKELARRWNFPNGDVWADRVQAATVDCIGAVRRFGGGSAFNFFTTVALNSFKMGLRASRNRVNSPHTNLCFDNVPEDKPYYTFSELLPANGSNFRIRSRRAKSRFINRR